MRNSILLFGALRRLINRWGFDIVRYKAPDKLEVPTDINDEDVQIIRAVRPFTMTSSERIQALCAAVRYVVAANILGAIVECGVWRGGSMMAAALTLLECNDTKRDLFLFDTFEGMSPPTERDVTLDGQKASVLLGSQEKTDAGSAWCYATLNEVRTALLGTGYPADRMHFVKGKVEDTIPDGVPSRIAILRLDTDWYESTRHELQHLLPRLSKGGVLIVDDYGHWQGARAAVDEYFAESGAKLLLNRIDYTGRIAVKVFE